MAYPTDKSVEATTNFAAGKYKEARSSLQDKLGASQQHNHLVADFYAKNQTVDAADDLLHSLDKILDGGKVEASNSHKSTFWHANYNKAVILYHKKQFAASKAILWQLFLGASSMEDYLAIRVCLLLLETLVETRVPNGANKEIQQVADYVEKHFLVNKADKNSQGADALIPLPSTSSIKGWLSSIKARVAMDELKLNAAMREWSIATDSDEDANQAKNSCQSIMSAKLSLYKGKNKEALKLLTSAGQVPDASQTAYYNDLASVHFCMNKFHAAGFYLSKALDTNKDNVVEEQTIRRLLDDKSPQLCYNFGLYLLFSGKPTIAFSCFQKALPYYYNDPLLWLRMGEVEQALYRFSVKKKKGEKAKRAVRKIPVNQLLAASTQLGTGGMIHLSNMSRRVSRGDDEESKAQRATLQRAITYMRNALALATATENDGPWTTTNHSKKRENGSSHSSGQARKSTNGSRSNHNKISDSFRRHLMSIRTHACVYLAWLALEASDPTEALFYYNHFPKTPFKAGDKQYKKYHYLINVYGAEALCLMGKLSRASKCLESLIKESTSRPGNNEIASATKVTSVPFAAVGKATLMANLASVYILKSDFKAAQRCIDSCLQINGNFSGGVLLQIYLYLRTGNTISALELLSKRRGNWYAFY